MINEMLKRIVRLLLPCKNVGKQCKTGMFIIQSGTLYGRKCATLW